MKKLIKGFIKTKIEKLIKADWNYKQDDPEILEKLKANIKRNSMIENLIIRELETGFYEVVNGNHRLQALQELAWKAEIMVYNLGKISLQHAERIAIETNQTRFNQDDVLLAGIIKEISAEFDIDDLVATMPYSEDELKTYIELTDFDFNEFDNDGEVENEASENSVNPLELNLTFDSMEQLEEFNQLIALTTVEGNNTIEKLISALTKCQDIESPI